MTVDREQAKATIQHALKRLVIQDSWERPTAVAAETALDALLAELEQLVEALIAMRKSFAPVSPYGARPHMSAAQREAATRASEALADWERE